MNKTDYKKELKEFYSGKVDEQVVVTVPNMNYLMIDGGNGPASQDFTDAIETLYPVAYTLKFMSKKENGKDYGVMPLEALWYMEDMSKFSEKVKDQWLWRAMIMQPDVITKEMYEKAVEQVREKKNPKSLDKLRFEEYDEGRAAQVMYVGPYTQEGPAVARLHEFIAENGGKLEESDKHHHEIYLSDPRRSAPEKLKTVIRQPF